MNKLLLLLIFCGSLANAGGKDVFELHCIGCHGERGVGAFGPNIQDSKRELIESKTQRGKYPTGYKPKRNTDIMPIIQLSKDEITALEKFLKK
jgi:mono/diheme cytochrome c family protein